MRCPFCGHDDTNVRDSRPAEDNASIRRRRFCPGCEARFTTFERVQLRELTVVKSDGLREPLDREKLLRSLRIALRKRPVDADHIDRVVNSMVRQLESSGETDIPTKTLGEMVMGHLLDLDQVACSQGLMDAVREKQISVTPPFKPALEEKLWFALFWLKPLEDFWRRELGERAHLALQRCIPYTWLVDPEPLPRHAVLPRLEAHSWDEVAKFSQKKRNFILKISGFSETAWGSRGVVVASDLPQREWKAELDQALDSFPTRPHILQAFHPGRLVEESYWLPGREALQKMRGRVRLCPYYFSAENSITCGGALATICPDDKKLLHGMRDAILAPTGIASAE